MTPRNPLSMGILQARIPEWVTMKILLQGTFLTQGSNPDLPQYRQTLYLLSHQGSPFNLQQITLLTSTNNLILKPVPQSVSLVTHHLRSASPWAAARQASLSITNSQSLLKFMPIESMMPYNHLIFCCPLLLLSSIFRIRVFSNQSILHIRWSKYWCFSFSISPSNEYSGLISFRMDWLDLLAVQGTLKSLLQHHSSKASILWCSAFFIDQLSHPYMTTGKTIALTRQTFVGKVMSLLFNMLSRLVITFLQRSKRLLISWLQSTSTVILEPPQKLKSVTVSIISPSICHEVKRPDAMILVF